MWAVADYLAVGTEHGILQVDCVDIRYFTLVHAHSLYSLTYII
jgi:hypothetical protein